jgi:3-(3-hydroxy-phenyl)propionate hydroxylase
MEREEQVWTLLSRWITPDDATLWRRASYRFHALVAKAWRKDCVFIAGDAAHQQPPFLGQGMCQGVRDVTNLAWKLQQVLSAAPGGPGGWRDRLLNTYGEERGAHVRELTATIKGIGRYVCERDLGAARARDARLLADTGGVVKSVPRQDLIPGLQTGCLSQQQHPARGSLFPQPRVLHRGKPVLLDDVAGGGWRVVLGGQAWAWQPLMRGTEVLGMQVLRVGTAPDAGLTAGSWQETEGVLATWFDRHASAAAIVRPDHYVYAMADSASSLDAELVALSNQLATSQPWRHL